jgi:hypothetical protein
VAAADLNGDGRVDLVAANAGSGTVGVLLSTSTPVVAAPTTTTLSTSTATAVFGQIETLTATVRSQAGTPIGTVFFRDGNTLLGSAPLDREREYAFELRVDGQPARSVRRRADSKKPDSGLAI